MNQKTSIGYGAQFAILLGLLGVALILSGVLMGVAASIILHQPILKVGPELLKPENANIARIFNTVTAFISFFVPAWVVARIVGGKPMQQLGFNRTVSNKQIGLVALIATAALFVSGSLGAVNELIPMPASFLKLARSIEESYKTAMLSMATMHSVTDYILSLLVIALAPAIIEEVLFRGSMQNILVGWTKNAWIGIIITAIIFSAIHGSYFGLLPRFALGIILGLIYYKSKNIWLSIFMHFINNGVVVTQMYILTKMGKPIEQAMDEKSPIWTGAIALIALYFLFRLFNKESDQVVASSNINAL